MTSENFLEKTNKELLKTKQKKFKLKGSDDNIFDPNTLNEEHKIAAKTILDIFKNCNNSETFKILVEETFKLKDETIVDAANNPLVKIIHDNGYNLSVQGYVTERENNKTIKYPIISYIADVRHFEKVYRNILHNMKEFFKKNPEALK